MSRETTTLEKEVMARGTHNISGSVMVDGGWQSFNSRREEDGVERTTVTINAYKTEDGGNDCFQ